MKPANVENCRFLKIDLMKIFPSNSSEMLSLKNAFFVTNIIRAKRKKQKKETKQEKMREKERNKE